MPSVSSIIKKGWAEKLAQGWLPGVPPPGYMTVTENGKRIHVPKPETDGLMEQVFRKYLEPGESEVTATAYMDMLGVRTRKGHAYNKSNVQKILGNPFYIGTNHFNGQDYPGAQQPIISKELWRRVQAKLHRGGPMGLHQALLVAQGPDTLRGLQYRCYLAITERPLLWRLSTG